MQAERSTSPGILQLKLNDKEELHRAYMPFVKPGGLFIPTDKPFRLGDEVFVTLVLPEESNRRPLAGKVVWLNKVSSMERPQGIGVQFIENPVSEALRTRIEVLLAGHQNSEKTTHTM